MADRGTEGQAASVHSLALQLLGQFARVQDAIDNGLAAGYFKIRTPGAADMVIDRMIGRLRDDARRRLFMSIANEMGTDAVLDDFASTFSRVKTLRDGLAHSGELVETSRDMIEIFRAHIEWPGADEQEIKVVDRVTLEEAIHATGWLFAQVMYVAQESGILTNFKADVGRVQFVKPSRLPKDWDPLSLKPVDRCGAEDFGAEDEVTDDVGQA